MKKFFIIIIGVVFFGSVLTAQGIRYSGNGKMILERTIVVHDNHRKSSPAGATPIDNFSPRASAQSPSPAADGIIGAERNSLQKAMAFNMSPYTPAGWSSPLVISNTNTATLQSATDASTIYNTDNIYVSFASLNNGADPTPTGIVFYCYIYIDDVLKYEGNFSSALPSNNFVYWINRSVGSLNAGPHTFRMEIDPTNVLSESNESDNTYQRSRSVSTLSTLPEIVSFSPANGPAGSSVTITGLNFGSTQGSSIVRFGLTAAQVTEWSATEIVAIVPNITAGSYTISVLTSAGSGTSTSQFTVTAAVTYPDPIPSLYQSVISSSVTGTYINTVIERFGVVWMTGDFGVVAKSLDISAGVPMNWTLANNGIGTDEEIYAIDFASTTVGFVGTGSGKIYRTTDGGTSWTLVYNNPGVTTFINRIKFDNTGSGMAMGDGLNSQSPMAYLHTTDGGTTWTNRNSQMLGVTSISQVCQLTASTGFMAGNYVDGPLLYRGVFRTTNGGVTWSFHTVGNTSADSATVIAAIGFQSASHGLAVKADSTVWRTTDGGTQWRKFGQLPRMGNGVTFLSSNTAFIAGRNGMVAQINTASRLIYSILQDPAVTFYFPEYSSAYNSILLPAFDAVRTYYTSINPLPALSIPGNPFPANNASVNEMSVSLGWSSVTGATWYDIEAGPAISSSIRGKLSTVQSNSAFLYGLSAGTKYLWRIRARSKTNASAWSPAYSFIVSQSQQLNDVISASFSDAPKASTDYRLVTVPNSSFSAVEELIPGNPPNDYRIFEDNGGAPPNHLSELSGSDSWTIGQGYWLIKKKNFVLSSSLFFPTPSSITGVVNISTRFGWNIIGTPYGVPVKWSDIRTANSLSINDVAYGYFGTKGFQPVDILEPYTGYYYFSNSSVLSIPFPFTETPDVSVQRPALQLTLNYSSSVNTDRTLTIGIDPSAKNGLDEFEVRKPPIFTDQAAIWIDRPDWDSEHSRFAGDIRPALGDGQSWDIVLQHPAGESSRLTVENMESIPEGFDVVIINTHSGVMLKPDAHNSVAIPAGTGTSNYSVIVGRQNYIRSRTESFVPLQYVLHQNYPNPFNPTTAIRFGITDDALVQLKVYDLLGREVASVVNGIVISGNHEYSFDARHLASGTYIYSLRAVSVQDGRTLFTSSKKMILLK
ncbi:MAG: IPT/TIG domain-containing protein [Bacteroidota bacterium]